MTLPFSYALSYTRILEKNKHNITKLSCLSALDSRLQEAFADAEKLIEADTAATRMTQQRRQTRLETNWESFRANLAYYAICQEALTFPQHCSKCSVELDHCVVRCLHCGPGVLFCSECDMQAHDQNPMHDREARFAD